MRFEAWPPSDSPPQVLTHGRGSNGLQRPAIAKPLHEHAEMAVRRMELGDDEPAEAFVVSDALVEHVAE
jgi:hypothetical protein